MTEYRVSDEGDPRKYYTQIPNMVDDMGLSVYAFRLYAHLKRVAGDAGKCDQSTATLAAACKMSAGSVKNAKEELAQAGIISIKVLKGKHGEFDRHEITIKDIWKKNMAQYATYSPDEQDRSCSGIGAHQDMNRTVSPHELKNNSLITINNNKDAKNASLCATAQYLLTCTGGKRLNPKQRETMAGLEETYGLEEVKKLIDWAANNGIATGKAITSISAALAKKSKSNGGNSAASVAKIDPLTGNLRR